MRRWRLAGVLIATTLATVAAMFMISKERGPLDLRVLARPVQPNEDGLVVEVKVLDPAEVHDRPDAPDDRRQKPGGFPAGAVSNPLLAGRLQVTIRNTSSQDLAAGPYGVKLDQCIGVGVRLVEESGFPLLPPFSGPATNSLKTLGLVDDAPAGPPAPPVLKAGESIVRNVSIWNGDGWSYLHPRVDPPTGVYTAQVVCVYSKEAGGNGRAVGPDVRVQVRPEDVREWRRFHDAQRRRATMSVRLIEALKSLVE
ncbi:hypothetical protein [Paludisphaera rhizosphaerae]|uniref:hypothetical protein n=1 Tax=Paludisphaera rhizosphaerae TaxID=2711216 RepID=UPI0013ED36E6|nr:hypothetical protein [Paludisphaera rhizosphaerae]